MSSPFGKPKRNSTALSAVYNDPMSICYGRKTLQGNNNSETEKQRDARLLTRH